jgi:hypothetical protein
MIGLRGGGREVEVKLTAPAQLILAGKWQAEHATLRNGRISLK